VHEQILLWHKARRSLVKTRVHLLNEADHLIVEPPLELRDQLPRTSDVRRLLRGLRAVETSEGPDPVTALRLRLLAELADRIEGIDRETSEQWLASSPRSSPSPGQA
jgi:hypothetical protein